MLRRAAATVRRPLGGLTTGWERTYALVPGPPRKHSGASSSGVAAPQPREAATNEPPTAARSSLRRGVSSKRRRFEVAVQLLMQRKARRRRREAQVREEQLKAAAIGALDELATTDDAQPRKEEVRLALRTVRLQYARSPRRNPEGSTRAQRLHEAIKKHETSQESNGTIEGGDQSVSLREKFLIQQRLHSQRLQRVLRKRQEAAGVVPAERYFSTEFNRKFLFREEDIEERSTRGQGPGGQATNRRMQSVILRHIPTGIIIRSHKFTSLLTNRRAARMQLDRQLQERLLGPLSPAGLRKLLIEQHRQIEADRKRKLERKKEQAAAAVIERRESFADFLQVSPPASREPVLPPSALCNARPIQVCCSVGMMMPSSTPLVPLDGAGTVIEEHLEAAMDTAKRMCAKLSTGVDITSCGAPSIAALCCSSAGGMTREGLITYSSSWWHLLVAPFKSPADVNDIAAVAGCLVAPLWLQYLFPRFGCSPGAAPYPLEHWEHVELERLRRGGPQTTGKVRQALEHIMMLFGLKLCPDSSSSLRGEGWVIAEECSRSWVEYRHRWCHAVTLIVFRSIHQSLLQLEMQAEAAALRQYLIEDRGMLLGRVRVQPVDNLRGVQLEARRGQIAALEACVELGLALQTDAAAAAPAV